MMRARPRILPRVLLVEGKEELRVLPELLERAGIPWPSDRVHASEGVRVGVWIMPDNIREGMLETMLLELRTNNADLDQHVCEATGHARTRGAPYREVHRAKAELHTWLAWQDPPGLQMHVGVHAGLLKPTESLYAGFVAWFRSLYGI